MPLEIVRRPGRPSLYIRGTVTVWHDGRPHPVSVNRSARTDRPEAAEGIRRQLERAILEANITGRPPAPRFGDAVVGYLEAGGDHRFLDRPVAAFDQWPVDRITQEAIDAAGRSAYPAASPATLRRQWHGPIIAVLRHAGIHTPFRRPHAAGRRTHWIAPAAADRVIAAAAAGRIPSPWPAALVTFLFGQGVRLGEAVRLDARDVMLDHRLAAIRDPKNGEERWITLTGRTVAAIATLPNRDRPGPLFRRADGRAYTLTANHGPCVSFLARCVAAAGLDPAVFTAHTLRHSWATWYYAQTRDVVRLRAEGGWRSAEWQRYTHIARPSIGEEALACGWDFVGAAERSEHSELANAR